ncbi:glycosyltransferase [Halomonas sp. TRM85114]|uniref:glycosyltransferase n=1 Tax=Halomonas jincaotanensis TaxID=2810616 RepID=UPI001BD3D894|nr:glycosyltransferase [Halomonas jincaotanensis]MBS9404045.1 glycosyltransferase [Halomonas jincaotanensis]
MEKPDTCRPITLFIPSLNGGGAERVFVNLANEFSRLTDHPVHLVLARGVGDGCYRRDVSGSVRIIEFGKSRTIKSLPSLVNYIKEENPQAILSTMSEANIVALLARMFSGKACRLVIREANVFRPRQETGGNRLHQAIHALFMKVLYPRADATVIIAKDILDSLEANGIRVCENRLYIGNPVKITGDAAPDPAIPASLSGVRYICAMGRLSEQKGFDVLIEAFALMKDDSLHLVIMGDGPLKDALMEQARRYEVAQRVHFTGFMASPKALIRHAEIFVSSSRWEGFPNALMEALSVGTPIVASACPGASGLILENGKHGLLVEPDAPHELAQAMSRSLVSPAGTYDSRVARSLDFEPTRIARRYLDEALLVQGKNGETARVNLKVSNDTRSL